VMKLDEMRSIAIPACRAFGVRGLDVFGSTARGEAGADSAVDLVVEFEKPEEHAVARFFGLLHHLEDHLQCRVDLLTLASVRDPYLRTRIMREGVPVYER